MKHVAALAAALCLLLAACTQEARPEGVAENWLRSLNQGAAGRPDRYAPDDVSEQVVPGWRDLEPGQIDKIEVYPADAIGDVLFRITTADGDVTTGTAHLFGGSDGWRVTSVDIAPDDFVIPVMKDTSGGLPAGWPLAALAAVVFALLALGLLTLVRRGATKAQP